MKSRKKLFLFFLMLSCGTATNALAATLTVTSTGDLIIGASGCSDGCSLREAIDTAASNDTIEFTSPLFDSPQIIGLTIGTLGISEKNLTINGKGARLLTVRRAPGAPNFGIFGIGRRITVNISGMTITGGAGGVGGGIWNAGTLTLNAVTVSGNYPGGIANYAQGLAGPFLGNTVTILNSLITNNTGGEGGIYNSYGTMTIANTTISGNQGYKSGGIYNEHSVLNLNNVTVTNNLAIGSEETSGGIIFTKISGSVNATEIRNSIIAHNVAINGTPDVFGTFNSNGNNLIGNTTGSANSFTAPGDKVNQPANIIALADNGGQSDTHALESNSPANNNGNPCVVTQSCTVNNPPVALITDQRGAGFPRQQGLFNAIDIGAFESSFMPTAAPVSIGGRVCTTKARGLASAHVTLADASGTTRTIITNAFGYYSFDNVPAGGTYIISVASKHYQFAPQVIFLSEGTSNLNFVP